MLNTLTPLLKKRKRVGRGGSRGGTSGKGHKGQKARSGPTLGVIFEGGQMPLTRRLPKRGFSNARFKKEFEIVTLAQLNSAFSANDTVTKEQLIQKRLIKGHKGALVKVLGNGELDKKLIVHADAFSQNAADAITNKGGEAHVVTREK